MNSPQSAGTTTFLFTDIEGSTQLWEQHPEKMKAALANHDAILRAAIESNHGHVIKTTGDGVHASFAASVDVIKTVLGAQRKLLAPIGGLTIKVRMGVHTGDAELRAGDYYGTAINRAARLMSIAHGGQILLSNATAELVREQLPANVALRDLGEHRLKDLDRPEHVFQLIHPDLPSEFPPLKSLDSFPNNLPIQLTSFIGREKEIAEIKSLLKAARLVTLTGSGGTGKTRLSIEIGAGELPSFANGVWLIELAPLADPSQIIPAMAQVFGLQELPSAPLTALVVDYLRDKKILLILDNCEHLIEACARLTDELLHQCAGLKILASSREALGIAGETAYHLPSLVDAESLQLFKERASATNSNFSLTDANTAAINQICSRLDGIPLAIELAAARTKLLTAEQIAARLDDRFRLLVGGSRSALPRQQTLRALIDWSYDLLSEGEQQLFQSASVFVGGWTLDAIEAVADDANLLEHLEQLVNKSLVIAEERRNEMRYFMLETIRQYPREKLFDAHQAAEIRDRHFFYFDAFSETMWDAFRTSSSLIWRDRADDEIENLRAALEWGLENYADEAIHLAANFCIISGWMSNQTEGLDFIKSALERASSLPAVDEKARIRRQKLIARAQFVRGMVGLGRGDMPAVILALQEAIALSRSTGDKLILGYSLETFYTASTFINAPGGSEAAQEGFILFTEEIQDTWGLGMAYLNMSRIAAGKGDLSVKQAYFGKLKEMYQDIPVSFQSGLFYLGMGLDESYQGNYQAAKQLFEDGLEIFRRLRNRNFQLVMTSELGHIARHTGDLDQAKNIYSQTIAGWHDLGNRSALAHQLECFALICIVEAEPKRAVKLFGAAEALREKIKSPMTDRERIEYNLGMDQLRSMLSELEFNALWADGRAMSLEPAIQLALG